MSKASKRLEVTCFREVDKGVYEQREEVFTEGLGRAPSTSRPTGRKFAMTREIPLSVFVGHSQHEYLQTVVAADEVVEVWDLDFLTLARFKQVEGDAADRSCLFYAAGTREGEGKT